MSRTICILRPGPRPQIKTTLILESVVVVLWAERVRSIQKAAVLSPESALPFYSFPKYQQYPLAIQSTCACTYLAQREIVTNNNSKSSKMFAVAGQQIFSKYWFPLDFSEVFRFQGIANIPSYVFHTFCLIYPTLSDEKFLSIGFHKTCHFLRFQGIANISSFVFHTFCLIYPDSVLSDENFLSIGFHKTCHFF